MCSRLRTICLLIQQWLDPQRLAEIVDEHVSYVGLASTRASYIGQQTASGHGRYQSHWQNKFGGIENGGANSHKFDGHKPQHQGQGQGKTILDVDALFVSPRRTTSQSVTNLKRKGNGHLKTSVLPLSNRTVRETLPRSTSHSARSPTSQQRRPPRATSKCLCIRSRSIV